MTGGIQSVYGQLTCVDITVILCVCFCKFFTLDNEKQRSSVSTFVPMATVKQEKNEPNNRANHSLLLVHGYIHNARRLLRQHVIVPDDVITLLEILFQSFQFFDFNQGRRSEQFVRVIIKENQCASTECLKIIIQRIKRRRSSINNVSKIVK